MHRLPRPSPAMFVSLLALFFALGGTAFAVGSKELAAQPRCAAGAVRGIAVVTGNPVKGLQNLSEDYTNDPSVFGYRWNCTGGQVLVRKAPNSRIGYDVKFNGNNANVAVVSAGVADNPAAASVTRNSDGSFHVQMQDGNDNDGLWQSVPNLGFVIIAM
jgi:hypothetical protein